MGTIQIRSIVPVSRPACKPRVKAVTVQQGAFSNRERPPVLYFMPSIQPYLALRHCHDYYGNKIIAGVDLILRFTLCVLGLEDDK